MPAEWWSDGSVIFWVVGVVGLYFLGTPLLILLSQKFSANPQCNELQLHTLEPAISTFIMEKTRALFELGFDEPVLVHMPNPTPGVAVYLVMLINRAAGDKAMVTALISEASSLRTCYVEFSTRYVDDQVVDTLNSADISAFVPGEKIIRSQAPSVTDLSELYRLHQYLLRKNGNSGKKMVYDEGQAIAYLKEYALKKTYNEQVSKGWLRYAADGDCYRPTIKGAYLITWGLLQPIKYFRELAMKSKEKQLLAEFRQQS